MLDATYAEAAPKPEVARLSFADLRAALAAGWRDFTRAPQFGLFFALVYALGGFAMVKLSLGHVATVLILSLGFPLIAPFAAVGLYVVSRRLARGERLAFLGRNGVLLRVWRERARQIPWIGAIIVIYFLFYTFFAHMLFAVFLGPRALVNISAGLDALMTPQGLRLIAVQVLFGAAVALLLYALTVVSIPFALDREVDFIGGLHLSSIGRPIGHPPPPLLSAHRNAQGCVAGIHRRAGLEQNEAIDQQGREHDDRKTNAQPVDQALSSQALPQAIRAKYGDGRKDKNQDKDCCAARCHDPEQDIDPFGVVSRRMERGLLRGTAGKQRQEDEASEGDANTHWAASAFWAA